MPKRSLKVTVRQKKTKKFESSSQTKQAKKFAELELGLQNRAVSKVRVKQGKCKKTLQSHH